MQFSVVLILNIFTVYIIECRTRIVLRQFDFWQPASIHCAVRAHVHANSVCIKRMNVPVFIANIYFINLYAGFAVILTVFHIYRHYKVVYICIKSYFVIQLRLEWWTFTIINVPERSSIVIHLGVKWCPSS